ncbi:protein aubergine-like [Phlebotomus argentipes]|uniref:protein aubergine-like n=1 Tax=Phlebotomus argentipes TaxID=94469 RepID=UPI002893561E|nr:protein aubergine-like [Phlebotomus argentipes]
MSDETPVMSGRARGRGRGQQVQQPQAGPSHGRDGNGDLGRRQGAGKGVPVSQAFSAFPQIRPGAPQAAGRATAHGAQSGAMARFADAPGTSSSSARSVDVSRGARRGNRAITDIVVTRPAQLNTKKGEAGEVLMLVANYFRVLKKPEWNVYKYRVDFSPDIELLANRKALMRRHVSRLGNFQFDGTMIFSPYKFASDPTIIVDKDEREQAVQITVRFVGTLLTTDGHYTHLLNLIMRNAIESLNMQRAYGPKGTKYFDPVQKIEIPEHALQVWPGFATSIRQHETDIMICAEVTHKVIRMESCYKVMMERSRDIDSIKQALIGAHVVTEYNNLTYRIDDVDFTLSPSSSFQKQNGDKITFIQYFRERYNCNIRDAKQPMLVSRAKARDIKAGRPEIVNLVPELCRLTGLTEQQRANNRLMRDMAQHTRIGPDLRVRRYLDLNRRIQNEPRAKETMQKWEMALDRNLVDVPGRVLPREEIRFGGDRLEMPNDADWTGALKRNRLFETDRLSNWHAVCTDRDYNLTMRFVSMLISTANRAGFQMAQPSYIRIPNDYSTSYVNAIEKACNDSTQIVMCVVPNQRAERYSAIKKKSCVERAVPTQVMWTKPMSNDKILGGIASKVMIQMNCKLGNAPWTVRIPLKGVMTVGFDVTFDTNDKSKSYGAFVATMDLKQCNTYFSAVSQHRFGEEMSNFLLVNMMKALKQFEYIHKEPPSRIFFYRDGVGEGDISHVMEFEVKKLAADLKTMFGDRAPKLTFIVVTKRINTRFFKKGNGHAVQNPPSGTVVDDVITLPERYDFYLVSQSTRTGTISPASYNVIYDESGLSANHIQMWTYKMTHLYYNWSGNVKVPAVCQYAQKLALLVGQHIHREPSNLLERQLFFL